MLKGFRILAHASSSAPLSGPFPVIFFIPGFGETRQNYTILCEELASHGYVVLSLDQPYVSNFVRFKDGSVVVPTFQDVWKTPRDRDYRYRYFDEAMEACIQDILYLLDHLEDLKLPLNPQKIALMGHSFGGNVAHTLGFKDPRVRAIVDLDSKITERKVYGQVVVPSNPSQKPVLFIRSNQYQEDVKDHLTKIPNAVIKPFDVQHSAFQDTAHLKSFGLEDDGGFSKVWKWFFKTGPIFDTVDTDLKGQNPKEWYRKLTQEIRLFLEQNLNKELS
jgi:dienelactone hydrolase